MGVMFMCVSKYALSVCDVLLSVRQCWERQLHSSRFDTSKQYHIGPAIPRDHPRGFQGSARLEHCQQTA